jgi:hypothetical protein
LNLYTKPKYKITAPAAAISIDKALYLFERVLAGGSGFEPRDVVHGWLPEACLVMRMLSGGQAKQTDLLDCRADAGAVQEVV